MRKYKNCENRIKLMTFLISFVFAQITFGQTQFRNHILNIKGVWIENNFKSKFDSNRSMAEIVKNYQNTDFGIYPIGLRINNLEIKNNEINIGIGILHSHFFYPEVQKYCVQNNDTIYEQKQFTINLNQVDSMGYYTIPDLFDLYAISSTCLLKINKDNSIEIFRDATKDIPQISLKYTRIQSKFYSYYQHPNPVQLYIRSKTLIGNYSLLDSSNNIITKDFTIRSNGIMIGHKIWKDKKIEFNTDVFCGGPAKYDKVLIYDPNNLENTDVEVFIYNRINETTIHFLTIPLSDIDSENTSESNIQNKVMYTLIKN